MKRYRIRPNDKVSLSRIDPEDTSAFDGDKGGAAVQREKLRQRLEALQEIIYAEHKHRVLIVLQAMDSGGKDGVIRSVFEGVNPQGVEVASFKGPTSAELDHDYLWRIHARVPAKGEITIFNRSHYEDVLVVRVRKLVPPGIWRKRYDHINAFERMLADEGVTILKFFLHISKDEQRQRLQERVDDPKKRWKFNPQDLEERKLWDDYMEAYEDVLRETSTDYAPWYVVPANRNWYRNLVVSQVLVDALEDLNPRYPEPKADLRGVRIE